MELDLGNSEKAFGVGINTNIVSASLEAIVSAVNRVIGGQRS